MQNLARTKRKPIPDTVLSPPERLEDLKTCPRHHLVLLWQGLFQTRPPKGASQPLLAALTAYEVQAQRHGGLGVRAQQRLSRIASGEPEKIVAPIFSEIGRAHV